MKEDVNGLSSVGRRCRAEESDMSPENMVGWRGWSVQASFNGSVHVATRDRPSDGALLKNGTQTLGN